MPSEDYNAHNVLQYNRKTFKNRNENSLEAYSSSRREDTNDVPDSPRSERITIDAASCSCEIDPEGEIANILHKKCPVIALAQQQLQRLLDGTDKLLCDNTRCCRSTYDFLILCKDALLNHNKCGCVVIVLILLAFFTGLLLGAASCGTNLRRFNSPILTCIDNFFIFDTYATHNENFRGIA